MAKATIHNANEIEQLRAVGKLAADTLLMVGDRLRPGMTTEDVNTLVHEFTVQAGARPAPLNYRGFPKSVCTSVNDVICHGIPSPRVLRDGDILNVDVTPVLPAVGGWHGDTNATFYIGEPSEQARHVVEVARECLELGIAAVEPGATLGDIGWAIQRHAERNDCSVVRDYTGHGIGRRFHSEPAVRHYGQPGTGLRLRRGMTFTIEPMINLGGHGCRLLDDGWTVLTRDGALSAQFEHTVVVTRRGVEVLTARDRPLKGSEDLPWARLGPLASFVP
jgi:methionyl aminopeptidase